MTQIQHCYRIKRQQQIVGNNHVIEHLWAGSKMTSNTKRRDSTLYGRELKWTSMTRRWGCRNR